MRVRVMSNEEYAAKVFEKCMKRIGVLSESFFKKVKGLESLDKYKFVAIMLTFKDMDEYLKAESEVGGAIRRYLHNLKRYILRKGFNIYAIFWVLEMQSRGVPHYHIFLVVDKEAHVPYPDQSHWKWGYSGLKILSPEQISSSYLSKYLQKKEQKESLLKYRGVLYRKKKYGLWVCKEWAENFFRVLIRRYNYVRFKLCDFFARIIKKIPGLGYDLGEGVFLRCLYNLSFVDGLVVEEFDGYEITVDNQKIHFDSFSDVLNGLSFVYGGI